ncbi:hypothetical protein AA0498_0621 [Acidomonas methanolica]|nr:hypothetical protein AA0498_0621 [Acidomonas methanolica]
MVVMGNSPLMPVIRHKKAKPPSSSDHHFPRGIPSNRGNTQPLIPEHRTPVTYRKSRLRWGASCRAAFGNVPR